MSYWLTAAIGFVLGMLVMELLNRWIAHYWFKPIKQRAVEREQMSQHAASQKVALLAALPNHCHRNGTAESVRHEV